MDEINPASHEREDRLTISMADVLEQIRHLVCSGRLGQFKSIEITEVIAYASENAAKNVLSIIVLSSAVTEHETQFLNSERIKIDGFRGLNFGLARTQRPLETLFHALRSYTLTSKWAIASNLLETGSLEPQTPSFVPPNSTFEVPINRVLKNNFWAGSHIFRLMDADKEWLVPFFDDRRRLQDLSDKLSEYAPLEISSLPDFLGDIIIQVPVETFVPEIRPADNGTDTLVRIHWHPDQMSRALQAAVRTQWDRMLLGAVVSEPFDDECVFSVNPHEATYEVEIWDDDGTLLAAQTETSTLRTSVVAMHELKPEPRLFSYRSANGASENARVQVEAVRDVIVGDKRTNRRTNWQQRRQELEEAKRLAETREFVQYRPKGDGTNERERALADVRFLIKRHGRYGVDLWDPYLTADGILQTLFWCPFVGTSLRGLTAEREAPSCKCEERRIDRTFIQQQQDVLNENAGNREALNLEFRTKRGPQGWAFHDRFLIFPGSQNGPLAWALGTSVNSLGKAHHILQKVPNPALVSGAFNDLWSELNQSKHLIWRSR